MKKHVMNGRINQSTTKENQRAKDPYTRKTAVSIKRNTNKIIVIYSSDKPKKWTKYYKFKITEDKRITAWANQEPCGIRDLKGNDIRMRRVSDSNTWIKYVSAKKLKKGTYYVYRWDWWEPAQKKKTTGNTYMFKWDYKSE